MSALVSDYTLLYLPYNKINANITNFGVKIDSEQTKQKTNERKPGWIYKVQHENEEKKNRKSTY
jgi:hypothetical protein